MDEGGLVRRQVHRRRPDGRRVPCAPGRRAAHQRRPGEFTILVPAGRADDPGGYRVDADPPRAELRRPGTSQRLQRAFRRAVQRALRDAEPGDPGAEVDDDAASGADHQRRDRLGEEERGLHVHGVHPVESLLVGGQRGAGRIDARVVDEDVDAPAQHAGRLPGQRLARRGAAVQVGPDEVRRPARLPDPGNDSASPVVIASRDGHMGARRAHRDGHLAPDIASCPGNEGGLALQSLCHASEARN
jgi:hypothetical protein